MKPRFLLDEHISSAIQRQLRRLEPQIDVLRIGNHDAPPIGSTDPDILVWLDQEDYILITQDRSTIPGHWADYFAKEGHAPGVFYVHRKATLGQIIEELYLIWMVSSAEEYKNCQLSIPF
ncbi:MAG: DUF5615 family PIN-like protein [Candidatus Parabeggiatoa sp.]|nr:DUF5615 family PIN-like protein [Candidatus Parabeggiatoa sp.]